MGSIIFSLLEYISKSSLFLIGISILFLEPKQSIFPTTNPRTWILHANAISYVQCFTKWDYLQHLIINNRYIFQQSLIDIYFSNFERDKSLGIIVEAHDLPFIDLKVLYILSSSWFFLIIHSTIINDLHQPTKPKFLVTFQYLITY